MRVDRIRPNYIPSEAKMVARCRDVEDTLRSLNTRLGLHFTYADRVGAVRDLPLQAETIRQTLLDGLHYSLANLAFEVGRVEQFAEAGVIGRGREVELTRWLDKLESPTAFYGGQWGEEGKRQVEASYGNPAEVVRVLGGPNAGSVVYTPNGEKVPLRHFPGGILNPAVERVLIAPGTNISLATALAELRNLQAMQEAGRLSKDIKLTPDRLALDPRCHVVFPHQAMHSYMFRGDGVGSEETGQGSAEASIYGRHGDVTLEQLAAGGMALQAAMMKSLAETAGMNDVLMRLDGPSRLSVRSEEYQWKKVLPEQQALLKELQQFADTANFGLLEEVEAALKQNRIVHFLATQGFGLDPKTGIRPYVSSSHTGTAGLLTGLGLPDALELIPEHMAVVPAYLTCKGKRPFVTEIKDPALAQRLRESAGQFDKQMVDGRIVDIKTDKKHRVGYMDAVMLAHYLKLNHVTQAALTKLDVWDGFDTVRVGIGYDYEGPDREGVKRAFGGKCQEQGSALRISGFNTTLAFLRSFRPVYLEFPWGIQVRGVKREADLPKEAVALITYLEQATDIPFHVVKTGPEADAMFLRNI